VRLGISNIAWPAECDADVARELRELGVSAVEVAPTRRWPDPSAVSESEARAYRAYWHAFGLDIVSVQALLFGRDDLRIFESVASRTATAAYLERIITLSARLGASRLVFGSPRNRRRLNVSLADAEQIALSFFRSLGDVAFAHGVELCIEPNPPEYGCDFLTTADETVALIRRVESPGVGLHLDSAAMTLVGEDPTRTIPQMGLALRHFHISEPYLQPIGTGGVDHHAFARALAASRYEGWVSIEMRAQDKVPVTDAVRNAVRYAKDAYAVAINRT
jgi:D-psicose/D-tagatose/L-ribulose 3-epimerase